ncbi:helix-turn-helix domain-containing protein [Actinomadura rupiterrae]|uniref:helix-turn-helix domain-containing protein n=1 Tax=Actinomadura rupiterrae TaxID=559627 RepID=UPI0020A4B81A|nr:helix-turn-helix domain-containing protein [Actinomadura rupiterrae]MCP2340578.1 excisionase family DNA binding protein [Actinomadura rupiterrae]
MADSQVKLMTVPEVMAVLNLGRCKVYDLIRSGALESVKVGRARRVPADAIDMFITHLREEAA